jgi:hypothetical protein
MAARCDWWTSIKGGFVAGTSATAGATRAIIGADAASPTAAMPVRTVRLSTVLGMAGLPLQQHKQAPEKRLL